MRTRSPGRANMTAIQCETGLPAHSCEPWRSVVVAGSSLSCHACSGRPVSVHQCSAALVRRMRCGGGGAECRAPRGKGPSVADDIELVVRFHPVGGEDVTLLTADFGGPEEALEAIARALDERRSLILTHARYNREVGENGVVVNLANVVSVRVSKYDSETTGQYL
jgi:hypothetical protein